MKPIGAFFIPVFMGVLSVSPLISWTSGSAVSVLSAADSTALRFRGEASVERFADGALEITLTVACPDPTALAGVRVDFGLDFDLDGAFDPAGSAGLSPQDCAQGALALRRDLFPRSAALLRLELRDGSDSLRDARTLFPGGAGALLALRRFCASPRNGEPEWIEVANRSDAPLSLNKVRLEGRMLSGTLLPGEALIAAGASDTTELRLWQPGARLFATSSWSSLRNSGDTVRLAAMISPTLFIPLDSAVYPATADFSPAREECASAETEETAASAHGFALSVPARWRPRRESLEIEVRAPSHGSYSLRVYDLNGLERCAVARGAAGPARFTLAPGSCALPPGLPALILLLEPTGAPPVRARVRLLP